MILLIRKRTIIVSSVFLCFFLCFSMLMWAGHLRTPLPVLAVQKDSDIPVIVIDAGHGGEDGGAVSPEGISESDINLDVSKRLQALFSFLGYPAAMTRTDDVSLSDDGLSTVRERKSSDLKNRVAFVNQQSSAVLISVHQNSLPSSPVTHGAQVFWNQHDSSADLANFVQDSLNICINIENAKKSRSIPASIYLMKHIAAPAILVECGFLSNAEEAALLQKPNYQTKLAAAISAGYLYWADGRK